MKRILTLVLCWLIAFTAMAETTLKAKTALSAAGGYITSLNKVDGSFEDGTAGWIASTDNIVQTASTEFQGNYKGVWSGTGAGTLDLQWTATSSNTYEASAQVNVKGKNDVYICAYVGTTETGCKLIPALSKIQKVSVVADSVLSSAFYLRLKHTGSDAFSIDVDDGKIEPWTPQAVNLVEQESIRYSGANLITTTGAIRFNNAGFNKLPSSLFSYDSTTGYFTPKKKIVFSGGVALSITTLAENFFLRRVSDNAVLATSNTTPPSASYFATLPFSMELAAGESVYFTTNATLTNTSADRISITATAISDNVVQAWQDGTEWTSYAPTGSWTTNTTYEGKWRRNGGDLIGRVVVYLSGSPNASDLYVRIPTGLQIDATRLPTSYSGKEPVVGKTFISRAAVRGYNGTVTYGGSNYVWIKHGDTSSNQYVSATIPFSFVSSDSVAVEFTVPILGWSSAPTLLALPAATQTEYYIEAGGSTNGTSVAQGAVIPFNTTTASVNASFVNGEFTAPLDGNYEVSGTVYLNSGAVTSVAAYVNGVSSKVISPYLNTTIHNFGGTIRLTQGQKLTVRPSSSTMTLGSDSGGFHWIRISRLNGKNDGVLISNLNPDGFNRTSGATGLVDNFSFSYGTTNASTVCSASPCSYLDQIGNYVTSVTRAGSGDYTANFSKTYSKLKCTSQSSGQTIIYNTRLSCENCNSLRFAAINSSSGLSADVYGNLVCQGY